MLLPIADMAEARLVLTDALVAESLRRGEGATRARDTTDNDNRVHGARPPQANENEGD